MSTPKKTPPPPADNADEWGEFASPPCLMHELDPLWLEAAGPPAATDEKTPPTTKKRPPDGHRA